MLIQTGRASGPLEYWRTLLEQGGVPVGRMLDGSRDTGAPFREESRGGKRRWTGGVVTDPAEFAATLRAEGLMAPQT